MSSPPTIALPFCLDTKHSIAAFFKERVEEAGCNVLIIDIGLRDQNALEPGIDRRQILISAGYDTDFPATCPRQRGQQIMADGLAAILRQLVDGERINGVLAAGGSGATFMVAHAVRRLPLGFPKMIVSTIASGETRSIVGCSDLILVPAVCDIDVPNELNRPILANAAEAICAMASRKPTPATEGSPLIAATMLGTTTATVQCAAEYLRNDGYQVATFHAVGSGGEMLEILAGKGRFRGILDLTLVELSAELHGSSLRSAEPRLLAAATGSIPQVIVPGAAESILFQRGDELPAGLSGLHTVEIPPALRIVKAGKDQLVALGMLLAERLNQCRGPAIVLLPLRGLSLSDKEDSEFFLGNSRQCLFQELRRKLNTSHVTIEEHDLHFCDPDFGRVIADRMRAVLATSSPEGEL